MKTNRIYFGLILLGFTMLALGAAVGDKSYAQEPPQVVKKPKPQSLWVLNQTYGPNISIFSAGELKQKTGLVASSGLSANAGRMNALTFDSSNALWIGVCNANGTGYLADLSARALRQLVLFGGATYGVIIQDPSKTGSPQYLSCPLGLAFDPAGNLWVEVSATAAELRPSLIEYKTAQLVTGRPTPSAVIETPISTMEPVDLVFDGAGNLWQAGGGSVFEYTAAQLTSAGQLPLGTPTDPYQTLNIDEASPGLSFAQALAFDAMGNLWVAFGLGGTAGNYGGLEMFSAESLGGSGTVTPTPMTTIDATGDTYRVNRLKSYDFESFNSPSALAFDSAGDLWVGNSLQPAAALGAGSLVEFIASQLTGNGSPVPTRAILANRHDNNLGSPHYMRFGPALP